MEDSPDHDILFEKIVELNKPSIDEKYLKKLKEFSKDSIEEQVDFQSFTNKLLKLLNENKSNPSKFIDDQSFDNPKRKYADPLGLPKLAIKILFLYNMSYFIGNANFRKFFLGIFYYYILFFLFLESLENISDEPLIDLHDIIKHLDNLSDNFGDDFETLISILKNCGIIATQSLFGEAIQFFLNEGEKLFNKSEGVPLTDEKILYFDKTNPNYYAYITPNTRNSNTKNSYYDISINRECHPIKEINNKIAIDIYTKSSSEYFDVMFEFVGEDTGDKTFCEQILFLLYHVAIKITFHMSKFIESWDDFIADPENLVNQNLDQFSQEMKTIINSYSFFNEFLDHKDLFRMVGTLDMEMDDEGIKKIRREMEKAKKIHLTPELSEKLKEANTELNILFTSVRGIKNKRDKEAIKYFNNHPHQFNILQIDDINDVLFTSEANAIRDARRKVLSRITKRYGKDIPPSRITKGLGLE